MKYLIIKICNYKKTKKDLFNGGLCLVLSNNYFYPKKDFRSLLREVFLSLFIAFSLI